MRKTIPIVKILDKINDVYGNGAELRINIFDQSFIEDDDQEIIKQFETLDELIQWTKELMCRHVETECNCKKEGS